MSQSLYTGVSGLMAHQRKLDVVANNLANINTTAYKSQRILFSDMMYNTNRPATGPSADGTTGGTNPQQIGYGVEVSQITDNHTQGVLTNTGEAFDFAIQGDGFFVVQGSEQQFTRDGAFTLDRDGRLVDPSSGGLVQRYGVVGEAEGFQTVGDTSIFVPLGASIPGQATTQSEFIGNLPAGASPPLAEVLTSSAPWTAAGLPVDATTLLNDLDFNTSDYVAGDSIEIVGTNADGSSFSVNVPTGAATTVGDLVNSVNAQIQGAQLSISGTGNLVVTADTVGDAFLSLNISDGTGNAGATDFTSSQLVVQTDGNDGGRFESTIQVFDARGMPHAIQIVFQKQGANQWDAQFSSGSSDVTLLDDLVANITFNEDGSFQAIAGAGAGDSDIELQIATLTSSQSINLSLADMTHFATGFNATYDQDGFPPGDIVGVDVNEDGVLEGISTNGQRVEIAQLAVATFSNNHGLESTGGNFYAPTANSGVAQIGLASSGGSGQIRGGQLETSNVDVALEFTQLIVAQRGFSANARTITVATEVLEELSNIIR